MDKLKNIAISIVLTLCCAKPLFGADEFVFFQAYVRGNPSASPGMIIPFEAGHQVGDSWHDDGYSFVAPVLGYYHFDVTVLISITSLNLTCPVQVQLVHQGGSEKRHPLYELRIHSTNVANTPNEFSWRPSGQLAKGSAGVNLLMHPGSRVYVKLTGGAGACYNAFTLNGSTSNNDYGSFISGYLIKSYDDSQLNIPLTSALSHIQPVPQSPSTDQQTVESQTPNTPANMENQQRTYDLYIATSGKNTTQLIKLIRSLTGVGLKEAKKMASQLEKPIATNKTKEEVLALAKDFKDNGVKTKISKH